MQLDVPSRAARASATVPPPWRSALSTRLSSACSRRSAVGVAPGRRGRVDDRAAPARAGAPAKRARDAREQLVGRRRLGADRQPALVGARDHEQVSASAASRSVSSAADASAAAQLVAACASRAARARARLVRIASGVRSSWLASATNGARARAPPRGGRASRSASSPRRAISSSPARHRQPLARRARVISSAWRRIALDRTQRRRRDAVAGERREQERDRAAEREQQGERCAAPRRGRRARRPTTTTSVPPAGVDRRRQQADRLAVARTGRSRSTTVVLARRARARAGRQQRRARRARRGVDARAPSGVEDLREALVLLDQRRRARLGRAPAAALAHERATSLGARAQRPARSTRRGWRRGAGRGTSADDRRARPPSRRRTRA